MSGGGGGGGNRSRAGSGMSMSSQGSYGHGMSMGSARGPQVIRMASDGMSRQAPNSSRGVLTNMSTSNSAQAQNFYASNTSIGAGGLSKRPAVAGAGPTSARPS